MATKLYSQKIIPVFLIIALSALMLVQTVYAYNNSAYGFSMTPPPGWTVDESVSGTVVMFYGPLMPETGTNANINVVVGNSNQTLSDAISSLKTDYPTEFTNYSLVSESSQNIGGLSSYELVYTFSLDGNNYKEKQVLFIENGHDYIISCTATPSKYDTYSSAFEQSIQTFQLTSGITPSPSVPEFPTLIAIPILMAAILAGVMIYKKKMKTNK